MTRHTIKVMPLRRKLEKKTDYKLRLGMLKSGKTRFVVRKTSKNTIVQAINYEAAGDKVLFTVSSQNLVKMGYKHSLSSIPAAYLTGIVAGRKAIEMGITQGVFDMGLIGHIVGSRIYGCLKGLVDAGVEIPCSEEVFPSAERLAGNHIAKHKSDESIVKDVNDLKKKIMA